MMIFGVCFVLYLIRLSAGKGSMDTCCGRKLEIHFTGLHIFLNRVSENFL